MSEERDRKAEEHGRKIFPLPKAGSDPDFSEHRRPVITDFLAGWDARDEEVNKLKEENERFRIALEKIANEDFRGNRPHSATVAYKALNE